VFTDALRSRVYESLDCKEETLEDTEGY